MMVHSIDLMSDKSANCLAAGIYLKLSLQITIPEVLRTKHDASYYFILKSMDYLNVTIFSTATVLNTVC